MMEKIEWYKEVLELEPNSKVFFPLAKLLVNNGTPLEAIDVLKQGLERHPDFTEARLFLIELMYREGQRGECNNQIQKLSKMFASYAGFWQAWAACLSSEDKDADTASILRFLAAGFLTGPLQIHEVLDLGISEIIKKQQDKPVSPEQSKITPDLAFSLQQTAESSQQSQIIESNTTVKENESLPKSAPAAVQNTGAAVNLDTLPEIDLETEEILAQEKLTTDQDFAISELSGIENKTVSNLENEFTDELTSSEEEKEGLEKISIRTRSMADVLAEQGDYQGALDIYEELATTETDPVEAENLRARIAELSAQATPNSIQDETPLAMATPSQKKEKLLGMLEALAKRVEARMHS